MSAKKEVMDIEEIREIEEDWTGSVLGYFTMGHIDKQKFTIAVNQEYDLAGQGSFASVSDTKHLYMIKVPLQGNGGAWRMVTSKTPKRGHTPITYCEI